MLYEKKKSIIENDVILVYIKDQPAFFARVEKIIADMKPGWWQVKLLILQIPLITATWILDEEQIRGADFTMSGTPVRIEKVVAPVEKESSPPPPADDSEQPKKRAQMLSLNSKKKS